jgi:hypothetical protein
MDLDLTPLINTGVAGLILLWFMLRLERILTRFGKSIELMARAVIRLLERHDSELASSLSKALSRTNGNDSDD